MSFARLSRARRNPLVLLPLVAACGVDASPPNAVVRDSAGVRIVEHRGVPEASRELRLSEQPLYRHGGRPDDRLFARVQRGVLRADGSAVLVDIGSGPGAAQEVFELTRDGSASAVIARSGQGPQEVRGLSSLHVLGGGDSLLLEDRGNRKLMVFAGNAHVRNISLQEQPDLARARVVGIAEDGQLLMTTGSYRTDFTVPWLSGSMIRTDPETLMPDTVATYDMAPRRDQEGPMNPFVAYGNAEVSGGRFIYLRSDIPQITWRAPDGTIEQIVRWVPQPVPITEEFLASYKEAYAKDLVRVNPGNDNIQEFIDRQLARIEVPPGSVFPIAQTMYGDDVGRVWLPEYMPTSGFDFYPTWYEVVDSDGSWLGRVAMPPRFRLLDVAGDRVLGVQLDELDVEHVVVYELIEG